MSNQDPAQQSTIQEAEVSSSFLSPIMDLPILHKIIYIGSFIIAIILLVILIFAISKNGFAGMFQKNINTRIKEIYYLIVKLLELYDKKTLKEIDGKITLCFIELSQLCQEIEDMEIYLFFDLLNRCVCVCDDNLNPMNLDNTTSNFIQIRNLCVKKDEKYIKKTLPQGKILFNEHGSGKSNLADVKSVLKHLNSLKIYIQTIKFLNIYKSIT